MSRISLVRKSPHAAKNYASFEGQTLKEGLPTDQSQKERQRFKLPKQGRVPDLCGTPFAL